MELKTRSQFPLFQTAIDLAHAYWNKLLRPGDKVIDATCGNGHDTLFLAQAVIKEMIVGQIVAIDRQEIAIENTKKRLEEHLSKEYLRNIEFYQHCHSSFPSHIINESISLIVYNLGYLPRGNKTFTTEALTTEKSLFSALPLVKKGGAISITCYPGHEAGKPEEEKVLSIASTLNSLEWSCCYHKWINRQNSPSLILLQRISLA